MARIRRAGSFVAHDAAGKQYTIHIFDHLIDVSTRAGHGEAVSSRSLKTANGDSVNCEEKGKYTILTGLADIAVTSSDPNAP
jgi:hypothetical protein